MNRILIVEDELLIANYICDVLSSEGYKVVGIARDHREALALFKKHTPTLVCMDISLKDELDGIALAAHMRELGPFALIYLTAYGDRDNVRRAQQTEPFGFLVKPVTDQTILATVATAMGNDPHINLYEADQIFRICCTECEPFVVDCASGKLVVQSEEIRLTPKESQMLGFLLSRQGEIIPFSKVKTEIWRDYSVSETSLKTLLWRLRSKLPDRNLIKTIPGFGYCIDAPIEKITRL